MQKRKIEKKEAWQKIEDVDVDGPVQIVIFQELTLTVISETNELFSMRVRTLLRNPPGCSQSCLGQNT